MTGFAAEWLTLREPEDAAARSAALAARLVESTTAREDVARLVVDLGAGTGANFRYLAPRLAGSEEWWLVDDDAELLTRGGHEPAIVLDPTGLAAPISRPTVRAVCLNLATGLDALPWRAEGLVTASALLDLVSRRWLEALAVRCAAAQADVLFALTYDGRIAFAPQEPEDEWVRALVNRHQRRDKGFGPALGPTASPAAAAVFEAAGYLVETARSDWRLGAGAAALQAALLEGWRRAAAEIAPRHRDRLDGWARRRAAHIAAGRSALRVGHTDLLGLFGRA